MSLNPLVDSRDVRFVLFEMLGFDKIDRFEHFAGFDKEVFEDTLTLAEKIAMAHFYPSNAEGDKIGLTFDEEAIHVMRLGETEEEFDRRLESYEEVPHESN